MSLIILVRLQISNEMAKLEDLLEALIDCCSLKNVSSSKVALLHEILIQPQNTQVLGDDMGSVSDLVKDGACGLNKLLLIATLQPNFSSHTF